jgi:hypothetical protein
MLDALARGLALDYSPGGDEYDVIAAHTKKVIDAGCSDPLVLYAAARGYTYFNRKYDDLLPLYVESAKRMGEVTYHPLLRCEANLRAAALRGRDRTDPRAARRDGRKFIAAAMTELPRMLADKDVPIDDVMDVFDMIGDASAIVERDRAVVFDQAYPQIEQITANKSLALTIKANELLDYSNDAKRTMASQQPSLDAQHQLTQRLDDAVAAAQQAWDADNSNPYAAEAMMRIQAARGDYKQGVAAWFDRAISAEPDFYRAYVTRLAYLEPKYQGSIREMIDFGHRCLANQKWETGIPMLLVEAHLRAAHYRDNTEQDEIQKSYFTSDADVWEDIKAVYEPYLQRYPHSLYHRSRYAQLACWCEQWETAKAQFQQMGDRFSLSWFRSREAYLRQKAAMPK